MIDRTGGIEQKHIYRQGDGLPDKVRPQKPQVTGDGFEKSESSGNYIIMPPPGAKKSGMLFMSAEKQLGDMDVKVEERLPVVDGYMAKLNEEKKARLMEAGYKVFEDKEENWLLPDPAERTLEEIDKAADGKEIDTKLVERPKLETARFDTPLSRKYQGEGVGVAIIDSGVYPHPDFINPDNRIKAFVDFVNGRKVPYDDGGHGTHVAGDAAGNGHMSEGLYRGSAPKADILALKALRGKGGGKTSNVIRAIQWCIQNKEKYNIRVINMSLGHRAQKDFQNDPTNLAVKKAYEEGLVVVTSAGNSGPDPQTLTAPADSPHIIAVGAADDNNTPYDPTDDKVADFSSRGPTLSGLVKPDVLAPGEAIVSTLSPGTEGGSVRSNRLFHTLKWLNDMDDQQLMDMPPESLKMYGFADTTIDRWYKSPRQARKEIKRIFKAVQKRPLVDHAYIGKPGTSMASPIVAGVVAQMYQANPDLTPSDVHQIIKASADPLAGEFTRNDQGQGMINPDKAIQMALDIKEGKLRMLPMDIKWPEDKGEKKEAKKAE